MGTSAWPREMSPPLACRDPLLPAALLIEILFIFLSLYRGDKSSLEVEGEGEGERGGVESVWSFAFLLLLATR